MAAAPAAAAAAPETKAATSAAPAKEYKLTYFNGRGLGETARLLFAAAGQRFTDVRIEQKDWPTIKATTPFGQVPTLEVDGKVYGQSGAIQRFLAREFGLFGSSELEGLAIDSLTEAISDARKVFGEARQVKDEEEKKAKFAAYFKDVFPGWAAKFNAVLVANGGGSGWFVGSKISLIDIAIFNAFGYLQEFDSKCLEAYPQLAGLVTRVAAVPSIATYLAARPATW
jgi:glutathione S-transferase